MKIFRAIILALCCVTCFAQQKTAYVLVDDENSFTYDESHINFGTYLATMKISDGKDSDYFEFIVNSDLSDDWAKKDKEISNPIYLKISDLKKRNVCDIHFFLSEQRELIIKRSISDKPKLLFLNYQGTYRNMIKSRLPKM